MSHETIPELRQLVLANPDDPNLRFLYGRALFRNREYRAALAELQQARTCTIASRSFIQRLINDTVAALGLDDEGEPPDSGSEPAPKPAPLRPITPRIASAARELPHDS